MTYYGRYTIKPNQTHEGWYAIKQINWNQRIRSEKPILRFSALTQYISF